MKLSILLVCYNQFEFIDQCIEGILIQQFDASFELIIADDCSTDGTVDRIQAILKNHPLNYRILISKHNLGLGKNYHRGIEACSGEYVAFLEGDDYWIDPLRLQKHIKFLDENPKCLMSFNPYSIYFQSKSILSSPQLKGKSKIDFFKPKTLIQYNVIGNLSTCVFRKSALSQIPKNWFDHNITDWLIGIFLSEMHPIAQLKEVMSVYRISSKGLWSRKSKEEQIKKKEIDTFMYDSMLGFRFTKEFRAYRIASRIKTWRDDLKENSPKRFKSIIGNVISQGLIIRISRIIAYSMIKKKHKPDDEIYNIF